MSDEWLEPGQSILGFFFSDGECLRDKLLCPSNCITVLLNQEMLKKMQKMLLLDGIYWSHAVTSKTHTYMEDCFVFRKGVFVCCMYLFYYSRFLESTLEKFNCHTEKE